MNKLTKKGGFTLIELLVVIGIIAILAAIVIVSINPAKRFKDARVSQRHANVESILNAIQQEIVDNKGVTLCPITASPEIMTSDVSGVDLTTCLADYLAVLPFDPSEASGAEWNDASNYDTKYTVEMNAKGQVTVAAPYSTSDGSLEVIQVTR